MKSTEWQIFRQLFHTQVEAVFRYCLISTGDWLVSERRTAEIFHIALAWFNPRLTQEKPLISWLWRIVRDSQSSRSTQFTEDESFSEAEVPQDQMRLFAFAAQVSGEWISLPHRVTEAMGLFYFGGLEIHQVADLTHLSTEKVGQMILQYGSYTLSDLSSGLHPVGLFSQELELELRAQSLGKKLYRVPLRRWLLRQTSRLSISRQEWTPYIVILAITGGMIMTAGNSFSSKKSYIQNESSPLVAIAVSPPSYSITPMQDNIIVADEFGQIGLLKEDTGSLVDPISGFRYFTCSNAINMAADPSTHSPGMPHRCNLNAIPKPDYPAQVSPNGRWLSIIRPIEKDSWILPLDGLGSAQKIANFEAPINWMPDGQALAFVNPLDPGNLILYDLVKMLPHKALPGLLLDNGKVVYPPSDPVLPRIPRPIQGNDLDRWYDSPDGTMSVLVEATSRIHTPCPCLLRLHPSDIGHSWLIYTGGADALAWTSDSSSLIVQMPSIRGPILIRIDAKTGKSQTIAVNLFLIGVGKPGQIESDLLHNPP